MISEGSCDTKNWSYDAENVVLCYIWNKLILKSKTVFHNFTVLLYFLSKNAVFKNIKKSY